MCAVYGLGAVPLSVWNHVWPQLCQWGDELWPGFLRVAAPTKDLGARGSGDKPGETRGRGIAAGRSAQAR